MFLSKYGLKPTVVAIFIFLYPMFLQASEIIPPPPQGPPQEAPQGSPIKVRGINDIFLIAALHYAGDAAIEANNEISDHKLSWKDEISSCDDCLSNMYLTVTTDLDRPNNYVVKYHARLKFNLNIDNYPWDRQIITPVDITISCQNWQTDEGRLKVHTRVGSPFLEDASSLLESTLDFFFPLSLLSDYIDNEIRKGFGPGSTEALSTQRCNSLKAWPTWAEANNPETTENTENTYNPVNIESYFAKENTVVVKLESIRRLNIFPANKNGYPPVSFEFYINGLPVGISSATNMKIAEYETVFLDNAEFSYPYDKLDTLQVIIKDSNSGIGWAQFEKSRGFSGGSRLLKTHRHIFLPPIAGGQQPLHPQPTDVNEFELSFTIHKVIHGQMAQ